MQKQSVFTLIKSQKIPELHTHANLYIHNKTKAQLLSLTNSDENKSFAITFRTPPPDSSGIAHIMEHSVLCGSKNYPLKEPFIELVKGSLNTFLNAFTYPDKTSYPVASTNEKDFYNLVRVYLDAVFFPLLTPETLMQEGWHLHQESSDDQPKLRGVVFNEMKGAYNSPDRALWDTIQASLLPDTPYKHDSGGDPLHIPDLTYKAFLKFHQTYYHPSNALLFFAGDDAESKRLALADEYLKQFNFKKINSTISLQKSFAKPIEVTAPLAISKTDDPKKKGMTTLSWVLAQSTDSEIALRLRLLAGILAGSAGSPLRKALIDSEIGEDLAGGGIESDLRQIVFSIGLKGMDIKKAPEVTDIITSTLAKLVEKGIASDIIAATMNIAQFHLREQNTGSFPRGLSLLYSSLPVWLYGGDPIKALSFATPFKKLKAELSQGEKVFEDLIKLYLLQNTHRAVVMMKPSKQEQKKRERLEKEKIIQLLKKMTAPQKKKIFDETKALLALQAKADTPQALGLLPKLGIADMKKENEHITRNIKTIDSTEFIVHPLETNGVVYLDLGFDLHPVPEHLLPLLPLFARAILEMGTKSKSFDDFLHQIGRETGGVWTTLFTSARFQHPDTVAKLLLRSKWLPEQIDQAFAIVQEALSEADFTNHGRFLQMVLEEKSEYESEILESGHRFADSCIRSQLHESDWIDEKITGIEQLFFLKKLEMRVKTQWDEVRKDLEFLRSLLFSRNNLLIHVTAEPADIQRVEKKSREFAVTLPDFPQKKAVWNFKKSSREELLITPTTVNYVAKGTNLYAQGYKLDGSGLVITRYLHSSWLWEQVRMKGGAYGAFSSFDTLSGNFTLISYRDPHIEETLSAFDGAAQFLQTLKMSEDELTKAIIGTISDFDQYKLPDSKGFSDLTRYLVGISDQRRQKIREEILSTTAQDFCEFAKWLELTAKKGIIAITTQREKIDVPGKTFSKIKII